MSGVLEKWLSTYKTRNISQTAEDRAKVKPTINCLKSYTLGIDLCQNV